MPVALSIGIPYKLFWHLNPNKLKAFYKAYLLKRKIEDENMWFLGQYIMSAMNSTVCNHVFWRGKNGKPEKYFEKPIMQDYYNQNFMTKEEVENEKLNQMILREEMWIKHDKKRGLPETLIK